MTGSTIAAISSAPGPGERGVVRLSGPDAAALVRDTVSVGSGEPPALAGRAMFAGRFHDGTGEQPVVVLWMPGPASYTREDVAELHLPGSPPLLSCALARLLELGATAAAPGEFTRRAFLAGRLDLTRAEGVLELIEASNEAERRAAAALLEGGLERRIASMRSGLDDLRALCEASLDFDESDTGHVPTEDLLARAIALRAETAEARSFEQRRRPAGGLPEVVLFGAPNAGKSTLFNALSPGARALTSASGGSTRDGSRGTWGLAGVPCVLVDAPGLDGGATGPDARAQELAAAARASADLFLWVVDANRRVGGLAKLRKELEDLPSGRPRILVWAQVDRPGAGAAPEGLDVHATVSVSAAEGRGLESLAQAAAAGLGLREADGTAREPAGRELSLRHRTALGAAVQQLDEALAQLEAGAPLDLVAEHFREATAALDDITGLTTPEDLLDRIFARFCIGK